MEVFIIVAAAVIAGAINSIAGGGTLISFPALIWIGRDPVLANATNTIAMVPGSLGGAIGFREELAASRRWLYLLIVPSLLGGIAGAVLLLRTPTATFDRLVPLLIFGATMLMAGQEVITRRLKFVAASHEKPKTGWIVFVIVFQFAVGVYGGYFGAGMGILMLAAMGLIGMTDLHRMNALKNVLAIAINGVAAIYFAFSGAVIWRDGLLMAAGAIAGGLIGARVGKKLGRKFVRGFVIAIGLIMTVALWVQ